MSGILDRFRAELADWRGLLRGEVPAARQALRSLLGGRLAAFTPQERDGRRY